MEFLYVKEGLKFLLRPYQVQNMLTGLQYHAFWHSKNLHRRCKKSVLLYRPGQCCICAIFFTRNDFFLTLLAPKPFAGLPRPSNIEIRGWYDTHEGYATGNSPLISFFFHQLTVVFFRLDKQMNYKLKY